MYVEELAIFKKTKVDSNSVQVLTKNVSNLDQVYKIAERVVHRCFNFSEFPVHGKNF